MITVNTDVYIERSPDDVFAFISDFENNLTWQAGMVAARFTSDGPLRAGSTYEQVASFLGRRVESTFTSMVEPVMILASAKN